MGSYPNYRGNGDLEGWEVWAGPTQGSLGGWGQEAPGGLLAGGVARIGGRWGLGAAGMPVSDGASVGGPSFGGM